ncbi:histidine phosphatase family protein [Lacticaseibacillus songhuajiangensis]|jgi:probable phosphoglycerate mutase|uniref:histidine phosphatase family protein n=1 Tax=Lacticaseibacillus songhuajiangensis TaxID=1296539 RepID=UPI000F777D98|nr:histidine phosphatase family protein [Lacticaseibacillus songhuajiangensis]
MKRLFIVRHGKTEWNKAKRLQGAGADSPIITDDITPYGQLAAYLDQYEFTAVYSSPLKRSVDSARLTLAMTGARNLPIQTDEHLRELSFGQWEGRTRKELIAENEAMFRAMSQRRDDPGLAALGMENFASARVRFVTGLRAIAAAMPADSNALIFTHGGIGQLGIKAVTGNERLLGLKNLSTSIVGVQDERFYLDVYNQTAYLTHVDLNEGNVSIL